MQPSTSSDLANRSTSMIGPHAVLVGAVVLVLAIAYADTFKWLWNYWIEGYNWQFLVPVAFVYMLRERSDLYSGLTRRPNFSLGSCCWPGVARS